jgi:hypothetical protein
MFSKNTKNLMQFKAFRVYCGFGKFRKNFFVGEKRKNLHSLLATIP